MNYGKLYPEDYRKLYNAEQLLKQSIKEAVKDLPNDTVVGIVGFLDEARPQTTDNRQRVWSFGKPKAIKNRTKYNASSAPIHLKRV